MTIVIAKIATKVNVEPHFINRLRQSTSQDALHQTHLISQCNFYVLGITNTLYQSIHLIHGLHLTIGMVSNGYTQQKKSNVISLLKDESPQTTLDVMNIFEQSMHSLIIVGAMQDNIFLFSNHLYSVSYQNTKASIKTISY